MTVPGDGMKPEHAAALRDWSLKGHPLEPEFSTLIEVYEKTWTASSQRFRWRAKRIGNWKKLANGGEGYSSTAKLVHALKVLWPNHSGSHVIVKFPDGTLVPLTEIKE